MTSLSLILAEHHELRAVVPGTPLSHQPLLDHLTLHRWWAGDLGDPPDEWPDPARYLPIALPEQRTELRVYEVVSEGTPLTGGVVTAALPRLARVTATRRALEAVSHWETLLRGRVLPVELLERRLADRPDLLAPEAADPRSLLLAALGADLDELLPPALREMAGLPPAGPEVTLRLLLPEHPFPIPLGRA